MKKADLIKKAEGLGIKVDPDNTTVPKLKEAIKEATKDSKGGNQYKVDPRQALFLEYYFDVKSETFSNAYKSAIKAGYSEKYAENITGQLPDWLSEKLGDMQRLSTAEENLLEVQNLRINDDKGKVDVNVVRERSKVDMFMAKTLGSDKYAERKELTGKGGEKLYDPESKKHLDEVLNQAFDE